MRARGRLILVCVGALVCLPGCTENSSAVTELRLFAANDTVGVIDQERVTPDRDVTTDGGGSLRVNAEGPVTVRLYEIDGLNFDDAQIVYRARLRTQDLVGDAYLEMWCHFPDRGDYFSRDVEHPLTGTTDWTAVATPFMLQKGQVVQSVRLNLVILGTGTVWIDDIHLERRPLP